MYHRIGCTGDPAVDPPAFSAAAQISHHADGNWAISDTARAPVCYEDRRGVQAPRPMPSLCDQGWLDMVHSTRYGPVSTAAP
jgi:hypothetical protein